MEIKIHGNTGNKHANGVNYPEFPHVHYYANSKMRVALLEARRKVLNENNDRKYLIGGQTGSGKSKLAKQLAYIVDPNFKHENICYTNKEFYAAIERAKGKKGVAIIHDEAFRDFSGSNARTKAGLDLLNTIMEMRKSNLFLFLVTPEVHKLNKTITQLEVNAMWYVWSPLNNSKYERYYKMWGTRGAKKIMEYVGKTRSPFAAYKNTPWMVRDKFYNIEPRCIDEKLYEEQARKDFYKRIEERKARAMKQEKIKDE